jgi:predicted RecB family nuclease
MHHVTGSLLYSLVACPQRVALDLFGDQSKRDPISPFVQLLWDRGILFERETIAALKIPFLDLSKFKGEEKERLTLEAMCNGEPLIYSGRICSGDLLGIPDLLKKSNGGYIPGDIKSGAGEQGADENSKKPKQEYAVQLGLYVDVLEQLGFSTARKGFIWDVHGNEVSYDFTVPLGQRTSRTLWDEYQAAVTEARSILARSLKPRAAYSSICKLCHWYSYCLKELQEFDDLTLIPYLGRSKRDRMQSHFSTIAQFASADVEPFVRGKNRTRTIFKGISASTLRTLHERAKLFGQFNPKPLLKAPIILPACARELFFDVEFDPLRDLCYLHGFIERTDGLDSTEGYTAFFVGGPTDECERDAFAQAMDYLRRSRPATLFYYSKYERAIYRKLQQRFPDVCSAHEIEELFRTPNAVDLYSDVVLPKVEFPTRDYSVKTLAQFLGFKWRDSDPSGASSIEWFNRWIESGQSDIKQRILNYNEDDCRATRVLLDGIRTLG